MMLPLPTTSEIDTTAEQLKDVERRRAAPVPNIAGAAVDAVKVGAGVQQIADASDARAQAQWFQKEYVDKGWEGYEKLWKESGAPAAAAPQIVRQAYNDSPVAAFKYLGELGDKAKAKESAAAYRKTLIGDDAAAADAGVKPETIYTEKNKRDATTLKVDASKENTRVRAAAAKTNTLIRQALAGAKDAGVVAAIERENQRKSDLEAEIDDVDKNQEAGTISSSAARKERDRLTRELSSIDARISGYIVKVGDVSKIPDSIKKPGAETEKKNPLDLKLPKL